MSKTVLYLSLSLCVCVGVIIGMLATNIGRAQTAGITMANVIATCGSGITYTANSFGAITVDTAGKLCVNQ